MQALKKVVDIHAPYHFLSRKEKKLKAKPWLSSGLLKSIRHKNVLYKKAIKSNNIENFNEYKIFRNSLNRTIHNAKQKYYNDPVNENKNCVDKLWSIVHELVNLKKKTRTVPNKIGKSEGILLTDSHDIVCYLNNYFANIGRTMASSISPVEENNHQNFKSDERRSIKNSPTEIINIIDGLQKKKLLKKWTWTLNLSIVEKM